MYLCKLFTIHDRRVVTNRRLFFLLNLVYMTGPSTGVVYQFNFLVPTFRYTYDTRIPFRVFLKSLRRLPLPTDTIGGYHLLQVSLSRPLLSSLVRTLHKRIYTKTYQTYKPFRITMKML